jgi:Uma2 family endonuclease
LGNVPSWRNVQIPFVRERAVGSRPGAATPVFRPVAPVRNVLTDYHNTAGRHTRSLTRTPPAITCAVLDLPRLACRLTHVTMNRVLLSRPWRVSLMTTLSTRAGTSRKTWTVADLHRRFGPIPFDRIRQNPPAGAETVADVDRLNNHEDRLYELIDGILVEKAAEFMEAIIAVNVVTLLQAFVLPRGLGVVAGADGMIQLGLKLVRIPDASFVSWDRLPGRKVPVEPIPWLVPDLVVEVISKGNTAKEMSEKLEEYFEKGVRLVWYVRPTLRVVDVHAASGGVNRLTASMQLDGGQVLPGFSAQVGELFEVPKPPVAKGGRKNTAPQSGKKKRRPPGR